MPAIETIREIQKVCECGKTVFFVRDGVVLIKCSCGKELPVVVSQARREPLFEAVPARPA